MANLNILDAQIYVGTYAQYNEGSLFGKWFKLYDYHDAKELFDDVRDFHNEEDDPEFMVQDYEGFPEEFYGESMGEKDLQQVYDFFEAIEDVNDTEALEAFIEAYGHDLSDIDDVIRQFKNSYIGEWDSEVDFVEQDIETNYEIPPVLQGYIDYQSMWDAIYRYDYTFHNGYMFYDNY